MANEDYKPRFTFEISEEQMVRCNRLLGIYGTKKAIFGPILDDLLDLIEEQGQIVIGIILDRAVKPREIIPIMSNTKKDGGE